MSARVDTEGTQALADGVGLVCSIDEGQAPLEAELACVSLDHLQTERVEGADGHGGGRLAPEEVAYTLRHLSSGLVGESERQHALWGDAACHEAGDPNGDHACLPSARPREDEHGAAVVKDGSALLGVQSLYERRDAGSRGQSGAHVALIAPSERVVHALHGASRVKARR